MSPEHRPRQVVPLLDIEMAFFRACSRTFSCSSGVEVDRKPNLTAVILRRKRLDGMLLDLRNDLELEREIRDPVHRYIKLTNIESRIVDSKSFQRLARISQMHSAHLVYPGAQYPRKVHALGTMHLAHRQLTRILFMQCPEIRNNVPSLFYMEPPVGEQRGDTLTNIKGHLETMKIEGFPKLRNEREAVLYTVQCLRLAALLHDVGHAPFSHLYEYATEYEFSHESQGARIVREVLAKPANASGEPVLDQPDAEIVARIMTGELPAGLEFLHSLISSPLDADKMDYLLRDSHYAGTPEYGTIDVDRILDSLVVHQGHLCYASDSLDSVVNALNAMFFMWGTVYSHKTARMFEIQLTDSLKSRISCSSLRVILGHFWILMKRTCSRRSKRKSTSSHPWKGPTQPKNWKEPGRLSISLDGVRSRIAASSILALPFLLVWQKIRLTWTLKSIGFPATSTLLQLQLRKIQDSSQSWTFGGKFDHSD